MVRTGGSNTVPSDDIVLSAGDGLLIVADQQEAIAEAAAKLGQLEPAGSPRTAPRSTTSASSSARPAWSACRSRSCTLPAGFPTHLLHVRRYDMDLVPAPDLMLEFGDRVGVLMPPDAARGNPQILRRHREGNVGVQLRVARARHGARRPAGPHSDPDPRRRHRHARHRRRSADRRADPRQAAPHRPDALDHAAARQHRVAQLRPCDVPRSGRHQCRTAVREDRRGVRA